MNCVYRIYPKPKYLYGKDLPPMFGLLNKMQITQRKKDAPRFIRNWASKLANFKTKSYFDILKELHGFKHIKTKKIIPFWDWEFKITPSKNKHLSKKGKYVVNCIVSRIK